MAHSSGNSDSRKGSFDPPFQLDISRERVRSELIKFLSAGSITPQLGIMSLRNTPVIDEPSQLELLDYRVPMNSPNIAEPPRMEINDECLRCCGEYFATFGEYQQHNTQIHGNFTIDESFDRGYQHFDPEQSYVTGFSPAHFEGSYANSGYGSNNAASSIDPFSVTPGSSAAPSRQESPVSTQFAFGHPTFHSTPSSSVVTSHQGSPARANFQMISMDHLHSSGSSAVNSRPGSPMRGPLTMIPQGLEQVHSNASSAPPSGHGSPISGQAMFMPEIPGVQAYGGRLFSEPPIFTGNRVFAQQMYANAPYASYAYRMPSQNPRSNPGFHDQTINLSSRRQQNTQMYPDLDGFLGNDTVQFHNQSIDHYRHTSAISESGASSVNDSVNRSPMLRNQSPEIGGINVRRHDPTRASKKIHRQFVHRDAGTPEPDSYDEELSLTPHRCTFENCKKAYKTLNGLKYHRTYFHGVLPRSAPSSPKSGDFMDGPNDMGGFIHPIYRRYKCLVGDCPKKYKNMSGLRYHLANAHPELSEGVQKEVLRASRERGDTGEFAETPHVDSDKDNMDSESANPQTSGTASLFQ
jgi:hypothetical protein